MGVNTTFLKFITIKINCHGGILSTGGLNQVLDILKDIYIERIRFGLRQCIYVEVHRYIVDYFIKRIELIGIECEVNSDHFPNIVSGYPAEELFLTTTWLSEGVYKDILDTLDYKPRFKINLVDSIQSFTPLFTGNINWVASIRHAQYWHLYLRFPKTNIVKQWKSMVYTTDLMRFSKRLETYILDQAAFNSASDSSYMELLIRHMDEADWISIINDEHLDLSPFSMAYYEGLNKQDEDHYWLGIYKRDEGYSVHFLKDLCTLCLDTRIGQICTTPWKSIIIKGIEAKDRSLWNQLLNRHAINVRHALNELNFQLEDNSTTALQLKKYLVHHFNVDDTRTQGICFGIKTRPKSEIFCNILIRKRYLIHLGPIRLLPAYDILVAKDFNPNERTGYVFASALFKYLLPDQLINCITSYYRKYAIQQHQIEEPSIDQNLTAIPESSDSTHIFQCPHCLTWTEEGMDSAMLQDYQCTVCEAPGIDFKWIDRSVLLTEMA